jgi:hypothetical protein
MWSPGAEGHIQMENTSFGGFSNSLHCINCPAAIGRIPVSGGLAAIFAGLHYQARFAGKSPGYASLKSGCPMSVHRYGIGLASSGIYPQNMPLIPPPPLSLH